MRHLDEQAEPIHLPAKTKVNALRRKKGSEDWESLGTMTLVSPVQEGERMILLDMVDGRTHNASPVETVHNYGDVLHVVTGGSEYELRRNHEKAPEQQSSALETIEGYLAEFGLQVSRLFRR